MAENTAIVMLIALSAALLFTQGDANQQEIIEKLNSPIYQHCRVREQIGE